MRRKFEQSCDQVTFRLTLSKNYHNSGGNWSYPSTFECVIDGGLDKYLKIKTLMLSRNKIKQGQNETKGTKGQQ